jgi:hypothetical protein
VPDAAPCDWYEPISYERVEATIRSQALIVTTVVISAAISRSLNSAAAYVWFDVDADPSSWG